MIYQIVAICGALLSTLLLGVLVVELRELLAAKKAMVETKNLSKIQMETHQDNMEMASNANESLGKMLQDQHERMNIIDERVNQLAGTLPTTQAGSKWTERARRTPPP